MYLSIYLGYWLDQTQIIITNPVLSFHFSILTHSRHLSHSPLLDNPESYNRSSLLLLSNMHHHIPFINFFFSLRDLTTSVHINTLNLWFEFIKATEFHKLDRPAPSFLITHLFSTASRQYELLLSSPLFFFFFSISDVFFWSFSSLHEGWSVTWSQEIDGWPHRSWL